MSTRLIYRFVLVGALALTTLTAASALRPSAANQGPVVEDEAQDISDVMDVPAQTESTVYASSSAHAPASSYDWIQFNFDSRHSGNDTLETTITPGNVAGLHKIFQVTLPSNADDAPAYLSGVTTPNGVKDVLFATTRAGHTIALDAHTGAQVWLKEYLAGTCRFRSGKQKCFTPSGPAVDPNRQFVYSFGLDGNVHKYKVGDGTEVKSGGWPELATLKPSVDKGSSDLTFATAQNGTTYLYMVNASEGDHGDYQGHLTAINLSDGSQHVFNALCSDKVDIHFALAPQSPDCSVQKAGIWARAGAVYDPDTNRIYLVTGNGPFNPASYDWGYTLFALNPDGTGSNGVPLDSYTPSNYANLMDLDPGSTSPAILPTPPNSIVQHLAVQGGKDGMLRLLNLDNLSGQGGTGHTGGELSLMPFPPGGVILSAPAVWVNPADGSTWVFYANKTGMAAFQLVVDGQGVPGLQVRWQNGTGGSSPILAKGILYVAAANLIRALDPTTGNLLWSDTAIGGIHWESPIVANGVLYISDNLRHLTAYAP